MTPEERAHHLRVAVEHLRAANRSLTTLLGHWAAHDLPADFLTQETYPFDQSLDVVVNRIRASTDALDEAITDAEQDDS